jgi:HD-GYP domain-containing protein (c-di-GMP phosphodiesterase class II)
MQLVTSPDDLVNVVARDRSLSMYRVRRQSEGWVELEFVPQRSRGAAVFLVVAWPELWKNARALEPHLVRARSGNYSLLLMGADEDFAAPPSLRQSASALDSHLADTDVISLPSPLATSHLLRALRARADACAQRLAAAALELEVELARHENDMLITVGRSLSQERDIKSLLKIILRRACEVTGADAGSIYTVHRPGEDDEEDEDDDGLLQLPAERERKSRSMRAQRIPTALAAAAGGQGEDDRLIRFKCSQNDSRTVEEVGFEMPVSSRSIVGACVLSGEVINIKDLYALGAPGSGNNPWGFVHDRSFDDKYAYQTRSMLAVPMISARDEIIGVIQLINKRNKGFISLDGAEDFRIGVVPFDEISVAYVSTLASQAGIALENVRLYREVKTLFDGFVKASVTAIESRDPTTSGHSERVAQLTVGLARAVDQVPVGPYKDTHFKRDDIIQIQYAALLHDFGKVGVREHVLVKARKLYDHQRDLILERFRFIRRGYQIEALDAKVRYLMESSRERLTAQLSSIDSDIGARLAQIDDAIRFILAANEPTVLEQGGFERIAEIAGLTYKTDEGEELPMLSGEEASALQIRRGSLTEGERLEINQHVVHTYDFLCKIPWGRSLRDVPHIAGAHHEKLDGTGYPNQLQAHDIPVAARMMSIADIYDALTAKDRPYKRALPPEKALDILASDVKKGALDEELFTIFSRTQVWNSVTR